MESVIRINILSPVSIYNLQQPIHNSDTLPHDPSELDESRISHSQDYSEYEHRGTADHESLYDQLVPPRLEQEVTQATYAYSEQEGSNFENPEHTWNQVSEEHRLLPPVTPDRPIPQITTPPEVQRILQPFPQLQTPTTAQGARERLQNLRRTFRNTRRRIHNSLTQPINQPGESSTSSRR